MKTPTLNNLIERVRVVTRDDDLNGAVITEVQPVYFIPELPGLHLIRRGDQPPADIADMYVWMYKSSVEHFHRILMRSTMPRQPKKGDTLIFICKDGSDLRRELQHNGELLITEADLASLLLAEIERVTLAWPGGQFQLVFRYGETGAMLFKFILWKSRVLSLLSKEKSPQNQAGMLLSISAGQEADPDLR